MRKITFAWDDRKAIQNLKKHGASFDESTSVFYDEKGIEYFDPGHSIQEDRFLMLGTSFRFRVLVVSYCFRQAGHEIRIISARKATKKEHKTYHERKL
jgi:uncharacterized protein